MKKCSTLLLALILLLVCVTGSAETENPIYQAYGRALKLNPNESLQGQYAGQSLVVFCCSGEFAEPLQESAAEFSRLSGAEVSVVVYPWEELVSKISLAFNGDEEMDVFCFASAFMKTYSTLGQLADLTLLQEQYGVPDYQWEGFIPQLLARTSDAQGHVFAIPYQICEMMTFYRKDLIGDTLPDTMEEIEALAAEYTQSYSPDSPTAYGYLTQYAAQASQWSWMSRLGYFGGTLTDDDWNVTLGQNDAAVKAMDAAKAMLAYAPANYVEYGFDEVNTYMAQGQLLMCENWSSAAPYIDTGDLKGKIGYANTIGSTPTISGWSLGINAGSQKQELAWKFVEFCTTEDGEMTRVDNGLPPARTANYTFLIENGIDADFYTALMESLNCEGTTWGDVCLPYLGTQGNIILADWTLKALSGEITSQEAVDGIVEDLKKALASVGIEK